MRNQAQTPWYRHRWPWILIAGPAVVVVAGFVTGWLAFSTADGLVVDDYYKQGLAVHQHMQRDAEAAARGLSAEVMLGADRQSLRVLVNGQSGNPARPSSLSLQLAHPTQSGMDQVLSLALGDDGFYSGRVKIALAGRWRAVLEDPERKWRLIGDWNPEGDPVLRLSPASSSGQ